jgi:hypothetical protein
MTSTRILIVSFFLALLSVPSIHAPELSKYRDFQLGMNSPQLAEQAGMKAAQAKLTHERAAVIQELEWQPEISAASPTSTDPVEESCQTKTLDRNYLFSDLDLCALENSPCNIPDGLPWV